MGQLRSRKEGKASFPGWHKSSFQINWQASWVLIPGGDPGPQCAPNEVTKPSRLCGAQKRTLPRSCPSKPRPLGACEEKAVALCPQLPPGRSSETDSLPLPFIDTLQEPGMRHPLQDLAREKSGRGPQKLWMRRGACLFSLTYCVTWANHIPSLDLRCPSAFELHVVQGVKRPNAHSLGLNPCYIIYLSVQPMQIS